MNHIGLGVAASDEHVVIVQILSRKVLAITKVNDAPGNKILVQGRMLEDKVGIYAFRLFAFDTKADISKIGPEMIEFDRQTREFSAIIESPDPIGHLNRKQMELFVRNNPDSIPYKKQTRDKLNLKHVDLILRIPIFQYPDPRYTHEDEIARLRKIEQEERDAKDDEEKRKTTDHLKKYKRGDRQLDSAGDDGSQKSLFSDDKQDQRSQEGQDEEEKRNDLGQPQKKFEIPKEQQISNVINLMLF